MPLFLSQSATFFPILHPGSTALPPLIAFAFSQFCTIQQLPPPPPPSQHAECFKFVESALACRSQCNSSQLYVSRISPSSKVSLLQQSMRFTRIPSVSAQCHLSLLTPVQAAALHLKYSACSFVCLKFVWCCRCVLALVSCFCTSNYEAVNYIGVVFYLALLNATSRGCFRFIPQRRVNASMHIKQACSSAQYQNIVIQFRVSASAVGFTGDHLNPHSIGKLHQEQIKCVEKCQDKW